MARDDVNEWGSPNTATVVGATTINIARGVIAVCNDGGTITHIHYFGKTADTLYRKHRLAVYEFTGDPGTSSWDEYGTLIYDSGLLDPVHDATAKWWEHDCSIGTGTKVITAGRYVAICMKSAGQYAWSYSGETMPWAIPASVYWATPGTIDTSPSVAWPASPPDRTGTGSYTYKAALEITPAAASGVQPAKLVSFYNSLRGGV